MIKEEPIFILAPLDDVSDTVFRRIVASCAKPDLFFTEFVNVDGLQSPGRPKLLHKLALVDEDYPVIAQLWGKNPENFAKTAEEVIEMGFAGVDINFGCPDKTVVKNNCCSAMIKPENRETAAAIIQAVKKAVRGRVPVSVKTRLGFNEIDLTWHRLILEQGVDMLTVHFRTRKEMSKVDAHWDIAPEIIKLRNDIAPQTKIIGNGDVKNRSHGLELAAKYKVDGVMIGRGVFHDPYCFSESSPWPEVAKSDKIALFRRQVDLFAETYPGGERKFEALKKFAKIYLNGFEGASELRDKAVRTTKLEDLQNILG